METHAFLGSPLTDILSCSSENITSLRSVLFLRTEERLTRKEKVVYAFPDKYIELIFDASKEFKLSSKAKFIALEIIEKNMNFRILDILKGYEEARDKEQPFDLEKCLTELGGEVTEIAITSFILATKILDEFNSELLKLSKVVYKNVTGIEYNVLQSEFRILKVIQFNIDVVTPIVYMEELLCILDLHGIISNVQPVHTYSLKVINTLYQNRTTWFQELCICDQEINHGEILNDDDVDVLKYDFFLLSSVAIAVACYEEEYSKWAIVCEELSKHTFGLDKEEIQFLSIKFLLKEYT